MTPLGKNICKEKWFHDMKKIAYYVADIVYLLSLPIKNNPSYIPVRHWNGIIVCTMCIGIL